MPFVFVIPLDSTSSCLQRPLVSQMQIVHATDN